VEEGTSTIVLTIVNNLGCGFFLIFPMIPTFGIGEWVNWAMVGACVAALICVIPFNENQVRSKVDAEVEEETLLPVVTSELVVPVAEVA
tara:strand:- start:264 stop:530 length:267 start_codon:yes stop_codon:yes gene_type:complete